MPTPNKPTQITKMTAADVIKGVRRYYGTESDSIGPEWSSLVEFSLGAGVGRQRADLFLIRAWSSKPKGHERVLIEVKVSRADLLHELANPQKMAPFAAVSHRVYFATPPGLVKDTDDLGPGIGLLEVHDTLVRQVRRAKRNDNPDPLPEEAVAEIFRRASRAEARHRDAERGDAAARLVAAEQKLRAAQRAEQTAREAARRDALRLGNWMTLMSRAGGIPCTCGGILRASRDTYGARKHKDGSLCTNRYGYPEIDVDALAKQLGLV